MPRDYNESKDFGKRSSLDFLGQSGFNKRKEVVMSEMQLSFEQLRNDIFERILCSLGENSHSFIHAAAAYGQDPASLILPNIESCMLLGSFGCLVLPYEIPNHPKLTLTVTMTLGRLNYTVMAHDGISRLCDLERAVESLAFEAGLKFNARHVSEGVRMELSNDTAMVSAPAAINILRQSQLEAAFKEFVQLQADRLIIGIAEILAQHGVRRQDVGGVYCLAVFKHLGYDTDAKIMLGEHFEILRIDDRDAMNIVYTLRSKEPTLTPLLLCRSVQDTLTEKHYRVHLEPTWGFQSFHESMAPVVVERIVVETQVVHAVIPEIDWKSMIREPIID
jgi:hypothetical protein